MSAAYIKSFEAVTSIDLIAWRQSYKNVCYHKDTLWEENAYCQAIVSVYY